MYYKTTSEIGFSLPQIYELIENMPGDSFTFDNLLDSIMILRNEDVQSVFLRVREASVHSEPVMRNYEGVYTNSVKDFLTSSISTEELNKQRKVNNNISLSNTKTSKKGLLVDCGRKVIKKIINSPQELIIKLPSNIDIKNIKGVKLEGHSLTTLDKLPLNLLILNVADCKLTSLKLISQYKALRVLNLSFNYLYSIEELIELPRLSEVYASNNKLSSLNSCAQISKLRILDASSNPIHDLQSISELRLASSLKVLKLGNTPLFKNKDNINSHLPHIQILDNEPITPLSNFAILSYFISSEDKENKMMECDTVNDKHVKGELTNTSRKYSKKSMQDVMEEVSSKECTIVSQRSIASSINNLKRFDNPIAAMMVAPAQGTRKPKTKLKLITLKKGGRKSSSREFYIRTLRRSDNRSSLSERMHVSLKTLLNEASDLIKNKGRNTVKPISFLNMKEDSKKQLYNK